MSQTVEQYLYEQLEKIAPGKYTLASVLQQFKAKLRFPCAHLKGGRQQAPYAKDYNLSIFTFPTGVTEVKCLYNCGLKIRSDETDLKSQFNDLYELPTTNSKASSEVIPKKDPGPVPTYSDEYRQRIKDNSEMFLVTLDKLIALGRVNLGDTILGGTFPHPDPIEEPTTIIQRGIAKQLWKSKVLKAKKPLNSTVIANPLVVVQDSIPEPAKTDTKIRKARKTQSRQRKRSGK